jgi:hypothetical protein
MANRANCFYLAGRVTEAESLYREIAERAATSRVEWDRGVRINAYARLAILAARRGDSTAARRLFAALDSLPPYTGPRDIAHAQARVAIALGERERAISLLRRATSDGLGFRWTGEHNVDYGPLRGFTPFEELLRPDERRAWGTTIDRLARIARR